MAGLCGLKILLLLAGLTGLANCSDANSIDPTATATTRQNTAANTTAIQTTTTPPPLASQSITTPPPPTTITPTTTPTTSSAKMDPTATATTQQNTTANITTIQTTTTPPPLASQSITTPPPTTTTPTTTPTTSSSAKMDQPVCSYTVQPEKFGFRIRITISHNYTINLTKANSTISVTLTKAISTISVTLTKANSTISHNYTETLSEADSVKNISLNSSTISHHVYLKPYTRYSHNVNMTMAINNSSKVRQCEFSGSKTTWTSKMEQNDIELVQCNTSGCLCYRSDWDMSSVSIGNDTLDKLQSCTGDKNHQNVFCSNNTFNFNDICSNVSVNLSFSTNYTFSLTQYITSDVLNSLKSQITLKPPDGFPAEIQWTNKPPKCTDNYAIETTCQEHNKSRKWSDSELKPNTNYNCTVSVTIKYNNSTIVKTVPVPSIDCEVNITSQVVKTTSHSFEISFRAISKKCPTSRFSYNCNYTKGKHNETMEHEHKCKWLDLKPNTCYDWKVEATYKNKTVGITEGQTLTAEGHNNKVLTGFLVFFIILTSVAMLFYVYKIYCRRRWNSHELVQRMELHQYLLIPGEDEVL